MELNWIDEIVLLREQRMDLVKLRDGVWTGDLGNFDVWIKPAEGACSERYGIVGMINEQYLRAAISYNAEAAVDGIDKRLLELGVRMPPLPRQAPPTVESVMAELKMYQSSWMRALGGLIRNKRHLIDALASTTEEMRKRAEKYSSEPTVSEAAHNARVTELLEFNNHAEERARVAERKLKAFTGGTDAERLALAVEQAAATVIADIRSERSS